MTTRSVASASLSLLLLAGCYGPSGADDGPAPQASAEDGASAGALEPDVEDCIDVVRLYSDRLDECYEEVQAVPDEYVEAGCEPDDGDWYDCVDEVEDFTACEENVGCASWHGALCWDPYRALTVCLGQPDPGAEPPACPWVGDGECDEPEGTGLCIDGTDAADCAGGTGGTSGSGGEPGSGDDAGPTCDAAACSGCVTDCGEYGCYSCCWGCNGDTCEESCNF